MDENAEEFPEDNPDSFPEDNHGNQLPSRNSDPHADLNPPAADNITGNAPPENADTDGDNIPQDVIDELVAPVAAGTAASVTGENASAMSDEVTYAPGADVVEPVQFFKPTALVEAPSIAEDLQAIAAGGGAVGANVLGLMTIAGSFITSWSIINGVMGILLGLWGLSSRRRSLAWIGLIMCVVGSMLSMMSINEFIQEWWTLRNEE